MPRLAALEFVRDLFEVGKKRFRERIKLFSFRRQRKRPPLKQRYAQKFLKLRHLRAHRRLLDAVGNVPHRRHNAAVPRDVIKQFEMVDVHGADDRRSSFSNQSFRTRQELKKRTRFHSGFETTRREVCGGSLKETLNKAQF